MQKSYDCTNEFAILYIYVFKTNLKLKVSNKIQKNQGIQTNILVQCRLYNSSNYQSINLKYFSLTCGCSFNFFPALEISCKISIKLNIY